MLKTGFRSKVTLALTTTLLLVMILGGCKPVDTNTSATTATPSITPEPSIQATDTPLDEAENTPCPDEPVTLSGVLEGLKNEDKLFAISAPRAVEEKLSLADIDIYMDATVDLEIAMWSIIEFKPAEVDQAHIDTLLKSLVGDTPIYLSINKGPEVIAQEIAMFEELITNLDEEEKLKAIYQEQLDIRTALMSSKKVPFNTNIHELGYIDFDLLTTFIDSGKPLEQLYKLTVDNVGIVDLGKDRPATIKLDKRSGKLKFDNIVIDDATRERIPLTREDMQNPEHRATLDAYEGVAYQLLDDMGYNGDIYYSPSYCYMNINDETYLVSHATRRIDKAHFMDAYWSKYLTFDEWLDSQWQQPVWALNDLICITDQKEVLFAEVCAPRTEATVLTRGATLLEFDTIIDIFKEHIGNNLPELQGDMKAIHIDGIHLSYMYVNGPQYEGQILLVPVWEFYGQAVNDFNMDSYNSISKDIRYGYLGQFNRRLLRIGAIDGVVVEP